MTHTDYVFGWRQEYTAEGVRDRAGTPADTQIYKFGIMLDPLFPIPHPRADPIQNWVYNSWDVASQSQGLLTVPHLFTFVIQNGVEFYFGMGSSTNTAPSYEQHLIKGIDKGHLPTRTFHYEAKGGGTDLLMDAVGRKTISADFQCDRGKFLTCTLATLGARGGTSKQAIFDNSLGTGPAVEYTNAPVLPPTANTDPYQFNSDYVCQWDGVAENTLHSWKLGVLTPMLPVEDDDFTHDDFGVDMKRWPLSNWEKGTRTYIASLIMEQNNRNVWDDFLDAVTNKTFTTTFKRATNDEIKIDLTDCQIKEFPIKMPHIAATGLFEVIILPSGTDPCTVTVKDAIDSDGTPEFYGG